MSDCPASGSLGFRIPAATNHNQPINPPPKKNLSITDYLRNNVSIFLSYEKKRTSKVRSGQMLKLQNVRG